MGRQLIDGAAGASSDRLGLPPFRDRPFCRRRGARHIELFSAQALHVRIGVALSDELSKVSQAFA